MNESYGPRPPTLITLFQTELVMAIYTVIEIDESLIFQIIHLSVKIHDSHYGRQSYDLIALLSFNILYWHFIFVSWIQLVMNNPHVPKNWSNLDRKNLITRIGAELSAPA